MLVWVGGYHKWNGREVHHLRFLADWIDSHDVTGVVTTTRNGWAVPAMEMARVRGIPVHALAPTQPQRGVRSTCLRRMLTGPLRPALGLLALGRDQQLTISSFLDAGVPLVAPRFRPTLHLIRVGREHVRLEAERANISERAAGIRRISRAEARALAASRTVTD